MSLTVSAMDWDAYIRRLAALNETAAEKMRDFVRKNGFGDMDALIDYAYALATKYGEGAATLAAAMYDAVAELSGKLFEPAIPAETASYDQVAKTVQGVAKVSQNPEEMGSAVGRLVKQAGADTTLQNALRDGAEFAWVPSGDTCAFCITLASRGWQRASKKAIKGGHAEHIHSNCDCTYAIRFDGKGGVAGYDPEKYLRMYEGAEGDTPREKINAMRRENYAEHKEEINAQKRAAYAARKKASIADAKKKTGLPGTGNDGIVDESKPAINPAKWDASFGPETWSEKRRKAMQSAEWSSTYKTVETARLYDDSGKQLAKKDGDKASVTFTRAEIRSMKGGVLTHNHPSGGCFSPNDINMLREGKLKEIRAVTTEGVFRLQQPEAWSTNIGSLDKVKRAYDEIDARASKYYFDKARSGEISYREAEKLGQEATVKELCDTYGIPFRFDAWDTIREEIRK